MCAFPGTPPCADIIASIWFMWVRTQDVYNWQYQCFQPIKVSFCTYPFISIHDRTPRILLLSLTCLIMPTDKIITQTIFTVLFTSGSLSHLGETPGHLIWCLPQLFICHQLSTNCILSLKIQHDGQLCLLFPGLWLMGEGPCITLGAPKHLPPVTTVPYHIPNQLELFSHQLKGLGGYGEILQWYHLPPSLCQGGGNRR